LLRRPQDWPDEIPALIALGAQNDFTELYRRTRIQIADGRSSPPTEPLYNLPINRWSAHAPGSTCFLPVNDLTFLYINGLLEVLNHETGAFILDERANFRPAGLQRFARSRGGHLEDDPNRGRLATIKHVELSEEAVEATVAYCEYVWSTYGRFSAHLAPFRTVVGYQAHHLDVEFYDRFYRADALSPTQRNDFSQWSSQQKL